MGILNIFKKSENNTNQPAVIDQCSSENLEIKVDMVPCDFVPNDCELVEITDKKLLTRLSTIIPNLLQAGVTGQNALGAQTQKLYRVIIPFGEKLANSRSMDGAKRAIYHGAKGIKGHANLVAVDRNSTAIANAAASSMAIASMVVGQYYMTQINAQLSSVNDHISKISSFHDTLYKSKVFALVTQVRRISSFKTEIIDNKELRQTEITTLNNLEQECIELLGQASLMISEISKKKDFEYKTYEKELSNSYNWHIYQKTLFEVLCQISDLKYSLHFGAISRENCSSLLPIYQEQVTSSQESLCKWHEENVLRLGIDTEKLHRERPEIIKNFLSFVGMKNFAYIPVSESTVKMIESQSSIKRSEQKPDEEDLYNNDVELIVKAGKVFYHPSKKNEPHP